MGLISRERVARGSSFVARVSGATATALFSSTAIIWLLFSCLRSEVPCSPASIVLTRDQLGELYFDRGDYAAAAEVFEDHEWRAVALYRAGEFERSARIWQRMATAAAAFNRGNALIMRGKYEDAIKSFDRALELKAGWSEARANRDLAAQRAKWLEKKGGDMTGGKLEADEIVFEKGESPPGQSADEPVEGTGNDADLRAIWLRQVETKPGDFLRARFAYELARETSR